MRRLQQSAVLALALGLTAPVLAQSEAQGLRPVEASRFALEENPKEWSSRAEVVADLVKGLRVASLLEVAQDANRKGTPIESVDGIKVRAGFRWNLGDEAVKYWWPQGISGSGAAYASESLGGRKILLVSWYFKRGQSRSMHNKGVRVSVVDVTSPGRIRYRHVLLVDPIRDAKGRATFKPVPVHAGGIAWVGRHLYVADTSRGFRVFDTHRILRVSDGKKETVGRRGNAFHAFDYEYVLPQVGSYTLTSESAKLRFSFVSLDRSSQPPSLLSGEYLKDERTGKLARWPLNAAGRLATQHPSEILVAGQHRMQGALSSKGRTFLACSSREWRRGKNHGRLYAGEEGQRSTSQEWVYGAEDLTLTPSTGDLWSLGEFPMHRAVFAVKLPGSGDQAPPSRSLKGLLDALPF